MDLGVADDKDEPDLRNRWHGIPSIEALNAPLQVLSALTPELDTRYEVLKIRDRAGYALSVSIEKSQSVHPTSDGTIYVRHGASSLPLEDTDRIGELSFAKGASSFEDTPLSEAPPYTIVDSFERNASLRDIAPQVDTLDFALNQNLLEPRAGPRVAADLLFAPSPSAKGPRKCAMQIARYETREEEPERDHLAEQATMEGPAIIARRNPVGEMKRIMPSVQAMPPNGLKHLDNLPEAIWETVANAIIHRDDQISDGVQILIFDDRIEILSPGKLPGYVTIRNILIFRYSRNPKLVRTLARCKNPPNKNLGEGLNTTFKKMLEWGLKKPRISEHVQDGKVTLPHARLAAPTELILEFLENNSTISYRQARDLTGIRSGNLVKIEFYKLRDEGLIDRVSGLAGPKSAREPTAKGKLEISKRISARK